MKLTCKCLILLILISCGQATSNPIKPHLAQLNKTQFDTLHDWNLGEALLAPISYAKNEIEEAEQLKLFSPGQRALYHFWYLNDEVTNGGFIQFYWNGYARYVPAIMAGLNLIADTTMMDLVNRAGNVFTENKNKFDTQKLKDDWTPLYDSIEVFNVLDSFFYLNQQNTMLKFEKYIRQNADQFVHIY